MFDVKLWAKGMKSNAKDCIIQNGRHSAILKLQLLTGPWKPEVQGGKPPKKFRPEIIKTMH